MTPIALAGLPETVIAEIEKLRAENASLKATIAEQEQTIDAFSETISGLNEFGLQQDAENARLRAALEAVEDFDYCPWCNSYFVLSVDEEGEEIVIVAHETNCKYILAIETETQS